MPCKGTLRSLPTPGPCYFMRTCISKCDITGHVPMTWLSPPPRPRHWAWSLGQGSGWASSSRTPPPPPLLLFGCWCRLQSPPDGRRRCCDTGVGLPRPGPCSAVGTEGHSRGPGPPDRPSCREPDFPQGPCPARAAFPAGGTAGCPLTPRRSLVRFKPTPSGSSCRQVPRPPPAPLLVDPGHCSCPERK